MKTRLYNELDRWSLKAPDRVVTSSRAFVRELELRGVLSSRIHVQHMAIGRVDVVPEERKLQLRARLGLNPETKVLLTVGRLSREKGHVDLIEALAKMCALAVSAQLRLVIVGEGPERPKIEKICGALGLQDVVTMVGQQNDTADYYAISDVFLLPSHSEGSPNVLLEAMAYGVPIVATSVGGVPEVVTDGENGILVKKGDRDSLAVATARLLNDRVTRDRLVSSARQTVAQRTSERYFESLASVFNSALCGERSGPAEARQALA